MNDLHAQLLATPLTASADLAGRSATLTATLSLKGDLLHIEGVLTRGEQTWTEERTVSFPAHFHDAPPIAPSRLGALLAAATAEREPPNDDDPHSWPDLLWWTLSTVAERLPGLFTPEVTPGGLADWLCAPAHPWFSGMLASDLAPRGRCEAHGVGVQVLPTGIRLTARIIGWDQDNQIKNITEQEVWGGPLPLRRWNDPLPDLAPFAGHIASWKLLLCGQLAAHDEEWFMFPNDLLQMWPWALLEGWDPLAPRQPRRSPVKRMDDTTAQIGAWTLGLRDGILLLHKKQEAGVPILWRDGERVHCIDGDIESARALLAWLVANNAPMADTLEAWRWSLAPLPSWEAGARYFASRGLLARLGAWRRYSQFLRTRQPGFQGWLERSLSQPSA